MAHIIQNILGPVSDAKSSVNGEKYRELLKNAIERYEGRRQELEKRHQLLNNRIAIMEQSVPALMAMNICRSSQGIPGQTGVEALVQMMKKVSIDPADDLVTDLTKHIEELNCETANLHDKIINADIQLMEGGMELESLELENSELEEQIKIMENRLNSQLSLETIDLEDRFGLMRIRELCENEIRLKHNIRELEEKEETMREQVKRMQEFHLSMNESTQALA